jgi:putative colanic acid biosynthesis glycosyltransferase
MRVLLIDVNCKYSSTGKIVYDLYTELNFQGHTASIAYGRGPLVQEAHILKYGIDLETMFHAFLTRVTGLTGSFSWFSTRRLLRHLKQFQPDVVHLHDLHGYHVNIGSVMKYLKQHHIRTIWTFHSEFMYTGKCGHAKDCIGFESNCGNCPLLREYPKSLFLDFTTFMLNQKKTWFQEWNDLIITTPSNWMKLRVKRSFLKDFPLTVVENGLDTNVFHNKIVGSRFLKYRQSFNRVVLSIIPNLTDKDKGLDWVLKIANNHLFQSYLFVVVTKDIHTDTLNGNVLQVPYQRDQHQLADIYSSVDVFLITSKYESYSMTSLEATACGLPVVGFKIGGIPEAVQGNTQYLVSYCEDEIVDSLILASQSNSVANLVDYNKVSSTRMLKEFIDVYSN